MEGCSSLRYGSFDRRSNSVQTTPRILTAIGRASVETMTRRLTPGDKHERHVVWMSALIPIAWGLVMLGVVFSPTLVSFRKGSGIFRIFSLCCCLCALAFLLLFGILASDGHSRWFAYSNAGAGWVLGWLFCVLSMSQGKREPDLN